jgi:hypothetical protein
MVRNGASSPIRRMVRHWLQSAVDGHSIDDRAGTVRNDSLDMLDKQEDAKKKQYNLKPNRSQ